MKNILRILIVALFVNFAYADKLSTIKNRGFIVVGITENYKPLNFLNRNKQRVGFEIELLEYIAREINVQIKYKRILATDIIPLIQNNQIDIAMGHIIHDRASDLKIDFSITYLYDGQGIIGKKNNKAKTYKAFQGKKIAALSQNDRSGEIFETIEPLAEVKYFNSEKAMLNALYSGQVSGITTDYLKLLNMLKGNTSKLQLIGDNFTVKPYAIALAQNESGLRDAINISIQSFVSSKKYNRLYKKWFVKIPLKTPELWL